MSWFQGIWVPLVTPFVNQAIDFVALRRLVAHLLDSGVDGIVVCGTTGEAAALGKHEQLAVLDAVLEWVPSQRVVMGLAGNNLTELLQFQSEILKRPLAGLLVPAPYYIGPSQAGLEGFFKTVADASSVPIIVCSISYRTGVSFEQATLLNIVAHEIVAIKDCGGNLGNTLALLASGLVDVLCGEDNQMFNALCLGATGAIAASAHLHPELFVQLHRRSRISSSRPPGRRFSN